jgi:hypothetical protein
MTLFVIDLLATVCWTVGVLVSARVDGLLGRTPLPPHRAEPVCRPLAVLTYWL